MSDEVRTAFFAVLVKKKERELNDFVLLDFRNLYLISIQKRVNDSHEYHYHKHLLILPVSWCD